MERIRPVPGFPPPSDNYGYGGQMVQGYGGYGPEPEDEGDSIDLRALFLTLWRGKWIIMICVLLCGVMGYLYVSQLAPEYRASAKVMFDIQQVNVEAAGEAVVASEFDNNTLQNQIEILRSTSLMRRVVEDLNLHANPAFNPALRPKVETWRDRIPIPPEIEDIAKNLGLIAPPPPPPNPEEAKQRLEKAIIGRVLSGLSMQPIRGSKVIEISYTSGNPRLSSAIVNSVAENYIVDQLEGKLDTFRSATEWLTNRVQELQDRVEASEARVLGAQAKITDETGASLEATREQLAAITGARATARSATSNLQAQYDRLQTAMTNGTDFGAIAELRASPVIATLRQREAELQTDDDALASTLLPNHPSRQRLADELATLRQNMTLEANRVLQSIGLQLETAQAQEAQLAGDVRKLEEQLLRLSTQSVEIRNLEREAQASRILYENLLARLQETNAQEDLQSADARILTPAEPPLWPVGAAKRRTLMVTLILGAALGIGIVFLLDRLNNTFRSPHQLEQMVGQPVLATIPTAGQRLKRSDVIQVLRDKPNSSLAESIRNLRTSILFSNVDQPPRVIMFSSSVPREGKSTTSMLMALTSRQMGKSAIIVDCDLRMPALSKVLKVEDEQPGLLSLINDEATLEDAIYKEPETGLHVLMTRSSERNAKINAADVLASTKFKQLIEDLAKIYDLVVLDTPPTLVVTDARIVSSLADAVVFAVRWDSTPRAAVQEGIRELASVRAPMTGVVMTQVNEQRASKYAYDGYSYYKGRYRDYYEV